MRILSAASSFHCKMGHTKLNQTRSHKLCSIIPPKNATSNTVVPLQNQRSVTFHRHHTPKCHPTSLTQCRPPSLQSRGSEWLGICGQFSSSFSVLVSSLLLPPKNHVYLLKPFWHSILKPTRRGLNGLFREEHVCNCGTLKYAIVVNTPTRM